MKLFFLFVCIVLFLSGCSGAKRDPGLLSPCMSFASMPDDCDGDSCIVNPFEMG